MTPVKRHLVLFSGLLLTSTAQLAFAEPIMEVKKWTLSEVSTSSGVVCIAATKEDQVFRKETFHLEIRKLKNQASSPAEVIFRIENNKQGNYAALLTIPSTGGKVRFIPLSGDNAWGVTYRLSDLVERLKSSEDSVSVKALGGNKEHEFEFNGRGFTAIIDALEARCNAGAAIASREFESLVTAGILPSFNPVNVSREETGLVRNLYFQSFSTYKELKASEKGLADVLAKYQQFIDQLNSVQSRLSVIGGTELPQAQARLAAARNQQAQATAELGRLKVLIPQLTQAVAVAQKNYDQARQILAPHEPEYNRLTSEVNTTAQSLRMAENRLRDVEARIQQVETDLINAQNEIASLERELPRKDHERRRAQQDLRDSESRLRMFDPRRETDMRLQRDPQYSQLRSEQQQLQMALGQSQRDLQQAQMQKNQAEAQLNQCRAIGTAGQPAQCSAQEMQLNQANQRLQATEMASQDLTRREADTRRRMMDIERNIHAQVQNEYDHLRRQEMEDRRRLGNIEDQIRRMEQRVSQLRSYEIPAMDRELYNLRMERPQVQSQISALRRDLQLAEQNLISFRQRTNWDQKAEAVRDAGSKLAFAQNELSDAQNLQYQNEQSLKAGKDSEARELALIANLNQEKGQLLVKEADLLQKLTNLPAQRAPWDNKIANLNQILKQKQSEISSILQ